MTLTVWEVFVFGAISGYLVYGLFRNALWTEAKGLKRFAERNRLEKWRYSIGRNLIPLSAGSLLLSVRKEIGLGWVWLAFGVGLVLLGLTAMVGFYLKKRMYETGFELESPTVSELRAEVGKMKSSSVVFLCLLVLWIYSWINKVV
jgi:hypothetical protein